MLIQYEGRRARTPPAGDGTQAKAHLAPVKRAAVSVGASKAFQIRPHIRGSRSIPRMSTNRLTPGVGHLSSWKSVGRGICSE